MRADNNQEQIVKALRACGATVAITNGKLSTEQIIFKDKWKGNIHVVETVDEALRVIGVET